MIKNDGDCIPFAGRFLGIGLFIVGGMGELTSLVEDALRIAGFCFKLFVAWFMVGWRRFGLFCIGFLEFFEDCLIEANFFS